MDKIDRLIQSNLDNLWVLKEQAAENNKKGHSVDIQKETVDNNNFRKVLYTGENTQLVLMSINAGEDIGEEVHHGIDQFFRIEAGEGIATINGKQYTLADGVSVVVPAGAKHNFVNTGKTDLKIYSLYSPPHHKDGTIHKTKADAIQDKEHFDGKTTEGTL
jgi:mannose-6-phosphate isomerase-like protein (cupin superfamily)